MAASPLDNTEGPVGVTVKIDGTEIPDDAQVLSIRTRNEVGRIPEAIVSIEAGSIPEQEFPEIDGETYKIGKAITLAAFYGDGSPQTLFSGEILSSRMRIRGGRGPRLELTCRDKAAVLTTVRKSAFYEAKKDSDIMTALISDAGLTASVTSVTTSQRDQLRYDCTDWDFLRAMADRNGHILTLDDGTVTSAPPDTSGAAVLTLTLGVDIIEFDAQFNTQGLIGAASGKAWDDTSVSVTEGTASAPGAATWGNLTNSFLSGVLNDREHVFTAPLPIESSDLKAMSDARWMKSAMSAIQGTCVFQGSALALPGKMIELTGVGERFGGTAFISGVVHKIESGSWTTETILGLPDGWLSDSMELGSAGAAGLTAPIHGLQVATVVKIDADPDSRQRIQIELPMIGDTPSQVWARFAQPYASAGVGIQFMPEIGDEVLVAFLNADPNAPVVIGSVYNGQNAQPNTPDAKNTLKTILTKSELKIEFDDVKKILTIATPGGHSLVLDDDTTKVTLEDSNGNKIEMSSSGIEISSPSDVKITGDNVDITALKNTTVSGANVTASADMQFKGEGGSGAELSSGGQTVVKGAIVMIN